jgi:hypothetical protein
VSPRLLPCDADALIQALLASNLSPLQILKAEFGIQPVIVPEVEIELASNRKFGLRLSARVRKALANQTIRTLDSGVIQSYVGVSVLAAAGTLAAIERLGLQHENHVDYGEAYTHAAALTLGTPAMSHDLSALVALEQAGLPVPNPVLRYFDLVVLGYQVGAMSEADCDRTRQELLAENEWLPRCFEHHSFRDGLRAFCPRLLSGKRPPVGLATPPRLSSFCKQVILS